MTSLSTRAHPGGGCGPLAALSSSYMANLRRMLTLIVLGAATFLRIEGPISTVDAFTTNRHRAQSLTLNRRIPPHKTNGLFSRSSRQRQQSSVTNHTIQSRTTTTVLQAAVAPTTLKPAALYLMDSGKALARSGEFLIDLTTALDLYGGALSASGAQIRNAGDCLAQAAASMRFKTGSELVVDELREAATCLTEAVVKLRLAVEEAQIDDKPVLAQTIGKMVGRVQGCGTALESAGEALMKRQSVPSIGKLLLVAADELQQLSNLIKQLSENDEPAGKDAAQRCNYAADRMAMAGNSLLPDDDGSKAKATGKGWLKGGA